jgi:hypothetical protein
MFKRQKNPNRDVSKAMCWLEISPALRFLCDLEFGVWNFAP